MIVDMRQGFMKAYDVQLETRFGSQIRMADFVGVHSTQRILSDQKYVLERAANRQEQGERPEADQLEAIFIEGVNVGGWLGDVTGDREAYRAQAQAAAVYDDFSHRLDAAVELIFAQPIQSHDEEDSLKQVTIGIDVTVSGAPLMILDKLTRHYSDRSYLPFGFSRLDYYAHDQKCEAKSLVPRYVIGVNVHEVRRIWKQLGGKGAGEQSGGGAKGRGAASRQAGRNVSGGLGRGVGSGQLRAFRPNSPESLQMRFKVLSEIRAQNLLYYAMLPEDQSDKVIRQAALRIDAVDECLNAALKDCVKQIVARKVVPSKVFAPAEASGGAGASRSTRSAGASARTLVKAATARSEREAIEAYFIAESERNYHNDDPFRQILGEARRLLRALHNPDDGNFVKRALTERRQIMKHNQALKVTPFRA